MSEITALQRKLDLPKSLANILLLLAKSPEVTREAIEDEHGVTKDAKVAVHRLRQKLAAAGHDILVLSRREVGYWLEDDDKAKVLELAKDAQLHHTTTE